MVHRAALVALLSLIGTGALSAGDTTASVSQNLPSIGLPHDARIDKVRFVVFYRVPASVPDVTDFFAKKMSASGWSAADQTPFKRDENESAQLDFVKGAFTASIILTEGRFFTGVMVGISKDEAGTEHTDSTAAISRNLPSLVLPPDAQLDKIRFMLFYNTSSKPASLVQFFTKQLSAGGWKLSDGYPQQNEHGGTEVAAEKDDFTGMVNIAGSGNGTQLFVSISREEPHSIMERQQ